MLEKINSKRFEKDVISAADQHQLNGGHGPTCYSTTNVNMTTLEVWDDHFTTQDPHHDNQLPAANNISSR